MKIQELDEQLKLWHCEKFGCKSVDLTDYVAKLAEEYGELQCALLAGDTTNIAEECVDMIFILFHIHRTQCFGNITDDIHAKLDIIFERLTQD